MSEPFALSAPKIFDGHVWHQQATLIVKDQVIEKIIPSSQSPQNIRTTKIENGFVSPGFVDLQVNGGGGILLNNDTSVQGIAQICAAHTQFGTTSIFPTLITDTAQVRDRAITAAIDARAQNVLGFAGLHLEGPHLSLARKGAHDPNLVRPMDNADVEALVAARAAIGALIVTLAPESATPKQVSTLTKAGVKISLGHSNAHFCQIEPYFNAGATMFTHLFNAMSQMTGREPGMVGTALAHGHASIIADGHHVHPVSIRNALNANNASTGKIFLISDAMSCIGTNVKELVLNGRRILRQDGKLTLEDGTLAGADIEMASAVRYMHQTIKLDLGEALRMATLYPVAASGLKNVGHLAPGAPADFVWLDENIQAQTTWVAGKAVQH